MPILLTTRDAAELIQVHESSIKRWCDAGVLPCERTAGGHRRIELGVLLGYASEEDLPCPLLPFKDVAYETYLALEDIRQFRRFDRLRALAYEWSFQPRENRISRLLSLALQDGVMMAELADHVIAPLMYRIGDEWRAGSLEVGDEHRVSSKIIDALHDLRHVVRAQQDSESGPVALVGCCEGNQHEIGALLARLVLEEQGWFVIYLGQNVPVEDFAVQQQRYRAGLVCMSLTPPQTSPTAVRAVRMLRQITAASSPFHIVVGGQEIVLNELNEHDWNGTTAMRSYNDLITFVQHLPHYIEQPAPAAA